LYYVRNILQGHSKSRYVLLIHKQFCSAHVSTTVKDRRRLIRTRMWSIKQRGPVCDESDLSYSRVNVSKSTQMSRIDSSRLFPVMLASSDFVVIIYSQRHKEARTRKDKHKELFLISLRCVYTCTLIDSVRASTVASTSNAVCSWRWSFINELGGRQCVIYSWAMPARLLAVVCCIICGATFAPLHFTRQRRRSSSPAPSPSPAVSPSLALSLPASLLLLLLHATLSTRRRVTRAPSTHEMDSPCLASQRSLSPRFTVYF